MGTNRNPPMHPSLRPSPASRHDLDELLDEGINMARHKTRGVPEYGIPGSDFRTHHNGMPPADPTHGGQVDAPVVDVFGRRLKE